MFTTEQVKGLVMSAAALAGDFQGFTPNEQVAHLSDVERQFDAWVDEMSSPANTVMDINGINHTLRVGMYIGLVGNSWTYDSLQGKVVKITGFDGDGDPLFVVDGDSRVAYGQHRDSYGWVPTEELEDYDF